MTEAAYRNDRTSQEVARNASSENSCATSSEDEAETSPEEYGDDDTEDDEAVYEAVITCLGLFSEFKEQTGSLHTSIKPEDHTEEHPSDVTSFVEDMRTSFNIWIDYTGALAADVSRALDTRLQGHKDIKNMVLEMLEMLARNMKYLAKTTQGGSQHPPNNDLYDEAIDTVKHSIEELHFMASVIRKSSTRSQNYSLSSGFENNDEQYFESYAQVIVRQTFPHARRSLCQQLGTSIAFRRRRLLHKIQHEEKLKKRREAAPVVQRQPLQPHSSAAPAATASKGSGLDLIPSGSVDTISNLNADMARLSLKAGPRQALSAVSMGSSVRLSTRKYPPMPYFPPGATDCACPYCARRLPTAKLSKLPTFWDDHLDEDVEPYVCLSEECTSPLLFFTHMKQWVEHMTSMHSEQWFRKIHMSTWYCDTKHDVEQFNDLERFVEHMKDSARHAGLAPPSDLQLDTLSRDRQKFLTRADEYPCPLCDCIPDTISPVIPTSDPQTIQHQLHKHIASHLKNLAVFSVPILTAPEIPESESEESEGNEESEGSEECFRQGQWALNALPTSAFSFLKGLIMAAANDDVQPSALYACERFGNTLAMSAQTIHKIDIIMAQRARPTTITFRNIFARDSRNSCVSLLGNTVAGQRFLALAAALVTSMGSFSGANAVNIMMEDSISPRSQEFTPSTWQLEAILKALTANSFHYGFQDIVVTWGVLLKEMVLPKLFQAREQTGQASQLPPLHDDPAGPILRAIPPPEAIARIVDAFRQVARLQQKSVIGLTINARAGAAWILAFTQWCLDISPSLFVDNRSIVKSPGSLVNIVIPASDSNTPIEVIVQHHPPVSKHSV